MAKYGSDGLIISWGAVDMSDFVTEINDVVIEALLQESHAFGDSWIEQLFTQMKRMDDVVLSGFFDDVAAGPDAKWSLIGTSAELILTWGGTKTTTVTCIIKSYSRGGTRGELTKFSVTLAPTGAAVEA